MAVKASSISSSEPAQQAAVPRRRRFPRALALAVLMLVVIELVARRGDPRKMIPYDLGLQEHFAMAAYIESLGPAEVSILGSSQVREGLMAGRIRKVCQQEAGLEGRVANYACSAGRVDEYHAQVQALLKSPRRPKLIVIGLAPRDLRGGYVNRNRQAIFWDFGDWMDAWRADGLEALELLPTIVRHEAERYSYAFRYRGFPGQLFKEKLTSRKPSSNPVEADRSPFQQRNPNRTLRNRPVPEKKVQRYVKLQLGGQPTFRLDDVLQRELDKTLAMCEAAGVPVVICEMPVTEQLKKAMPPGTWTNFLATVGKIAANRHARLVTVEELGVQTDDEDYCDITHLNRRGAAKLSDALAAKVIAPALAGASGNRVAPVAKVSSPDVAPVGEVSPAGASSSR